MALFHRVYTGAWGWPAADAVRVPDVGDALDLPEGHTATVTCVTDGPTVEFKTDGVPGHLRDSSTADGLWLRVGGRESDGYSIVIVDMGECGGCRRSRRTWRVRRGGRPTQGGG